MIEEIKNEIFIGNCVDVMKQFPDNIIDLTVTSPPYDDLRNYNGYSFDFENVAKQLFRITKEGGILVWVVNDSTINGSESGTSFKQALFFKEIGFNLHDTMIYFKGFSKFPDSVRYGQSFEYMFVFCKGKSKTFNPLKEKSVQSGNKKKITDRNKNGNTIEKDVSINEFKTKCNVWVIDSGYMRTTKDIIAYEHPAQFPEKLAEDHILSWSNEGDLVFDPMCGSGTTLKMALKNNRNYCGIDISEKYVNEIVIPRLNEFKNRNS